jgi:MSHA biogenesis protein MshO
MRSCLIRFRPFAGFSLVELVIVIAITGIIAAVAGIFVLRPIQGYNAQVRRADLVDTAESALRRMQRDIRAALPNSVRILTNGGTVGNATCPNGADTICAIEILHTADGARYRASPPGDPLLFNNADTQFDIIGTLQNAGSSIGAANWVVVNNQTVTGTHFNAYNCPNAGASHNCVRLTPAPASTPTHMVLAAAFSTIVAPPTPPLASERQRFYIVDTPVTFRCDPGAGTLTRFQGYTIALAQPVAPANFVGGTNARIANLITGCRFTYTAGMSQRAGVVTLELTVTDPNVNGQPESVRLLHQVHVYNVP